MGFGHDWLVLEDRAEKAEKWAAFLAAYVDAHSGKGTSDHAWDLFIAGKTPYDD